LVNHPKPAVALFGGSFDPPHQGHQQIIRQAIALLEIDRLIVVPAYLNPFKSTSLAPAEKRLEWCHQLFDAIPKVTVDDYEVKQGRSIRTSQTVKHFNTLYEVQYLIIGSDNLSTLTEWHEFEWLDSHITWVIATRGDHPLHTEKLRSWKILEIDSPISSTQIREKMDLHYVDTKIKQSVHETLKENSK